MHYIIEKEIITRKYRRNYNIIFLQKSIFALKAAIFLYIYFIQIMQTVALLLKHSTTRTIMVRDCF